MVIVVVMLKMLGMRMMHLLKAWTGRRNLCVFHRTLWISSICYV